MGTRCGITLKTGNQEYVIYNQFDGYLSYVGLKCLEIAAKADEIKTALSNIEIFAKSDFTNKPELAKEIENRVKNFDLIFPEWERENNTDSKMSPTRTFRFYDAAADTILGLTTAETNFLITDSMENIIDWIDYNYVIDLDNKNVTENSRGFFFDTEKCEKYNEYNREYFDLIDKTYYAEVRYPEYKGKEYYLHIFKDTDYLSIEELNEFLIKKI